MKVVVLAVPSFAFVVGTRVALGVGIGLLVSERLTVDTRRRVGSALVAIGAATTVAAVTLFKKNVRESNRLAGSVEYDSNLVGVTRFARKGDDVY